MLERQCVTKKTKIVETIKLAVHISLEVTQFLTKNNMAVVPQPQYSLDLTHCDFALFPKIKLKMESHCFDPTQTNQKRNADSAGHPPGKGFH